MGSGGCCTIGDVALMRANKQFITVQSSYELRIADKLINEQRKFTKPLRLDREKYLPDFILNDCESNWVMEIFSVVGNPQYEEQKAHKLAYYRENGILCWQWTPDADDSIPAFPDR